MTVQARSARPVQLEFDDSKAQTTFVLTTLLSSLVLQRFGVPFGEQLISFSVVIVAILAAWYLWNGVLGLDRQRVAIMFGVLAVAILSYSHSVNAPYAFITKLSLSSLLYWLFLTSFAVLRFSQPMDERAFFQDVIRVLAFIAICGVGAFLAQFVGLTLFSFQDFVPPQISMEYSYNVVIPFGDNLFKANGLFLLEPSIFSQFMALGLACEWVTQRRPWLVGLFLFALFSAASGTGWLALGGFVAYIRRVRRLYRADLGVARDRDRRGILSPLCCRPRGDRVFASGYRRLVVGAGGRIRRDGIERQRSVRGAGHGYEPHLRPGARRVLHRHGARVVRGINGHFLRLWDEHAGQDRARVRNSRFRRLCGAASHQQAYSPAEGAPGALSRGFDVRRGLR